MRRQIKLRTRKELTAAISQRYKNTDRKSKKLILDEFIKVTGYHRKHAIRILTAPPVSLGMPAARSKSRIYGEAVKEALIVLWEASDRICGKRLKVLLPQTGGGHGAASTSAAGSRSSCSVTCHQRGNYRSTAFCSPGEGVWRTEKENGSEPCS